jgi:hypothetical protein
MDQELKDIIANLQKQRLECIDEEKNKEITQNIEEICTGFILYFMMSSEYKNILDNINIKRNEYSSMPDFNENKEYYIKLLRQEQVKSKQILLDKLTELGLSPLEQKRSIIKATILPFCIPGVGLNTQESINKWHSDFNNFAEEEIKEKLKVWDD